MNFIDKNYRIHYDCASMRDIYRGEEQTGFPRVPGTVSEITLKNLIENAEKLGWHSIAESSLQREFISDTRTVKIVLYEFATTPERAVVEGISEIDFRPPQRKIGIFDFNPKTKSRAAKEVQEAILWYELNKIRKQETPRQELYPYTNDGQKFVAIRKGASPVPNLAPIPHLLSVQIIASLIENPDFEFSVDDAYEIAGRRKPTTGGSIKDLIDILKDNLDVMDKLFGFGKKLRFQDGVYSAIPTGQATPKAT